MEGCVPVFWHAQTRCIYRISVLRSALLLGFLLGTAAHQARDKSPAVIRFEPALQQPRNGTKSMLTYPYRAV